MSIDYDLMSTEGKVMELAASAIEMKAKIERLESEVKWLRMMVEVLGMSVTQYQSIPPLMSVQQWDQCKATTPQE